MHNLLDRNNVLKRATTKDKSNLLPIKETGKDKLQRIHQNFRNNFKTNVRKRDRAIISNKLRIIFLWDECDESFTPGKWKNRIIKEVPNRTNQEVTNGWTKSTVKLNITTVGTRGLTYLELTDNLIYLLLRDISN